ncbi:MAG: glycosyltransferase family 1 protein [Patescibacteria group bacterium]
MRIGIDARFYGPLTKGLGRYSEKLIQYLQELDHQNEYVIFLRKETWEKFQPKNANFKKVLADFRWYSLAEQIKMPGLIKKQHLDLMHFPHFNVPLLYRDKFVVTIHDLILTHFPTQRASTLSPLVYWLKHLAYRLVIRRAVKKAARIITISQYSKKQIIANFGVAQNKIAVTYEATSDFKPTPAKVSEEDFSLKYKIQKPYLLYVGNAYPHKNLERLISVFKTLVQEKSLDLKLVFVGKLDYFYTRLQNLVNELKLDHKVYFLGYVEDEELKFLYQNALLYVFPSLEEGFGLPPLEAMTQGLPVVSSKASCLPEILNEAAYYFDPKSEKEMAEAIIKMTSDGSLRNNYKAKGINQVKKYAWPVLARETLEIYQSAINNR